MNHARKKLDKKRDKKGEGFVLPVVNFSLSNYIDDIIGVAPSDEADNHFKITLNLLNNLGFLISSSKTVPRTSVSTCLGIVFNIRLGVLQIPNQKLQPLFKQKIYFKKSIAGSYWLFNILT
jgi:hypothetical protein